MATQSDIRVHDYLNDKFQSLTDLASLDSLLTSVQTQQSQLRAQLSTADSTVDSASSALKTHSEKLLAEANAFQAAQAGIDRRLLATTSAVTAAEAAEQFETTVEKLRRLDVARGYVDLLRRVQELSEEARRCVDAGNPEAALLPYTQLQELVEGLKTRNEASEEAAVHLVHYVDTATGELWKSMRERLAKGLDEVLAKVKWPRENVEEEMKGRVEVEFRVVFEKLLVLQGPSLKAVAPLLPFEVLVKPLALRFRYHFEGDRPTNRVDKPEWFLAHLTGLVTTYSIFLTDIVQPILSESTNPLISPRDAVSEFITALLPIVRRKTKHLLPQILDQAQLLSHFIHEMIKFDAELREEFFYAPFGCEGPWKGMTHEVLVVENGFAGWLKVEKEFALSRYHTILAAEDAWTLDYESVEPTDSKPTKSAMRLKDLLETVTESYRPLISFSQRLRFLIDIQLAILDQYHERLSSSVEKFQVLSSAIARAMQGTTKEEQQSLSGLAGLERLCKVYGSLAYMENCMRDWSEDIFFLELWEELETRAAKSNTSKAVAGNLNLQEVASITSNTLISSATENDGALFDATAESYKALRLKTEEMIAEHLASHVRDELKAYTKINNWATLDPALLASSTSPELIAFLSALQTHLSFLRRTLSPTVFRRCFRSVANSLQTYLWDYVIARNTFSFAGGSQFARDMNEVWRVFGDGGEATMGRVAEACVLLALPVEGDSEKTLRGVVKPAFEDNAKARECMAKLGIKELAVGDVRGVLQRRVEAFGS